MLSNCGSGEGSWESFGLQGNQTSSILSEINPQYSLEGLMLMLQYFGHLMQRTDSLENTLMLRKTEGRRRKGWQRMRRLEWHHWLNGYEFEQTPGSGDGQGGLVCCSPWGHKSWTWLSDWTERNYMVKWQDLLLTTACSFIFPNLT